MNIPQEIDEKDIRLKILFEDNVEMILKIEELELETYTLRRTIGMMKYRGEKI